jgi:hypothetical protein
LWDDVAPLHAAPQVKFRHFVEGSEVAALISAMTSRANRRCKAATELRVATHW